MLSLKGMTDAIKARVERPELDDDQLVPEHAIKLIDRVMESYTDEAFAADSSDTDAGRFARIYVYYTEYLRQIAPSLHRAATRHFERYMAALIRGAQTTQYRLWTDGVDIYACT